MKKCCAECDNYNLKNYICKEYKKEIFFPLYGTLYCDNFKLKEEKKTKEIIIQKVLVEYPYSDRSIKYLEKDFDYDNNVEFYLIKILNPCYEIIIIEE